MSHNLIHKSSRGSIHANKDQTQADSIQETIDEDDEEQIEEDPEKRAKVSNCERCSRHKRKKSKKQKDREKSRDKTRTKSRSKSKDKSAETKIEDLEGNGDSAANMSSARVESGEEVDEGQPDMDDTVLDAYSESEPEFQMVGDFDSTVNLDPSGKLAIHSSGFGDDDATPIESITPKKKNRRRTSDRNATAKKMGILPGFAFKKPEK